MKAKTDLTEIRKGVFAFQLGVIQPKRNQFQGGKIEVYKPKGKK